MAFNHCSSLASVSISDGIETIENLTFCDCTSLSNISIPNSVKKIGLMAFARCYSLTNIVLPNNLTTIGELAFSNCSKLESLSIPNCDVYIGSSAFAFCTDLCTVISRSIKTPSLGYGIFDSCNLNNATLFVPVESIEKYKVADQWKEFGTIKAIEGTNDIPLINMNEKTMIYNTNGSIQNNRSNGFNIIQNTNGECQKVYIK